MKAQKPARRKRPTLAQQVARLEAANDRAEAYLKAHPPLDMAEVWGRAFSAKIRR